MSHIGRNIRKIRTLKKLSQAEFADHFNLARASVGAYEEGRAEPKIDTVQAIAGKYGISIDLLLNKELTLNDLVHFDNFHKEYSKSSVPIVKFENSISYVSIENQIDYLVRHDKNDFIESLPKITLLKFNPKNHRAFELSGSEMEYNQQGLHHGDIMVCEKVDLDSVAKNIGQILLVITNKEFITRRLKALDEEALILKPDDHNYNDHRIASEEIIEIWKVKAIISEYLNPPKLVEEKILEIEKRLKNLEEK